MNDLVNSEVKINSAIEKALMVGDLSKLNEVDRLSYFKNICTSLGLNPLTKPFQYITLQGKLTLYATKACTDQLRKLHGISIEIKNQKVENGLFTVTVEATDKHGRKDSDLGVLPLGNKQGDYLANIIMKTVTKAKRRVTLSICGLGMLDESEIESIPRNQVEIIDNPKEIEPPSPEVEACTGKILEHLGFLTQGKNIQEKGEFLQLWTGVKKANDLKTKSLNELKGIEEAVYKEVKKKWDESEIEEENPDTNSMKGKTAKDCTFKLPEED